MRPDTFTPGPWEVRDDRKPGGAGLLIWADAGGTIAFVTRPTSGDADARLLASAPDLLASLTDAAIRCAGLHGDPYGKHRCVTCAKWLDVIAKAVGR